jgi:hypothetical protein
MPVPSKSFRRSDSFQSCALGFAQSPRARFSPWLKLADAHAAELIALPFTKQTVARGVIPEFLRGIGINSSQFRDFEIRRNENERVGPFTVSVARDVLRWISETGKAAYIASSEAMQSQPRGVSRRKRTG